VSDLHYLAKQADSSNKLYVKANNAKVEKNPSKLRTIMMPLRQVVEVQKRIRKPSLTWTRTMHRLEIRRILGEEDRDAALT
jgi:hypothetical protein